MVKLNTWAGLEPAVMDIKTVSGLAQVFELTLTDSAGSVVDLEGVTFRGAVNTAPLQEFVCSIKDGKVLFGWIGLPAGRHSFDLFMVTGAVEKALIHGAFVVVGRVLPPLDKESYSVNNAATVVFPDTVDGTLLIELSEVGLVDLLSRRAGAFTEEAKGCLGVIRELKEWIGGKVDGFGDVVETASTAITEAGTAAVSAVEASHTEAVKAVSAEKEGALTLVNGAGETATTAITEARKEAVKAVSAEKEGALTAVNGAGEMATTAITEAGTEAVKTVSAKKDAAVSSIQTKQADSVLAVGRAQKTATDKVASVQGTAVTAVETAQTKAVTAVQTARTEAVETIIPLVERAETAKESIDQAESRIKTVATNADQSAQTASNAATAAQQALEAIPQADAAGNMTLAGGLTAAGTINANGGINIPLAVPPVTDTAAVNRLYAAGFAGVTGIYTIQAYLDTGSITATGSARTTAIIPGHYAETVVPANTHSTVVHGFRGPNGQWNYSSFAGLSIPYQLTAAGKITIGIGGGGKTIRRDLTLDSYSVIPGNDLAYSNGEILDITFAAIRDTIRNGYAVRVREIYGVESKGGWAVKTSTSFVPASHNEPIPYNINKIIYQQRLPRSYGMSDYGDPCGALFFLTGGGSKQSLWQIATVRGVVAFETGIGWSSVVTDIPGIPVGDSVVRVGAAERTNYQPGDINPVYYALEAIAGNAIETESTADFVDINNPID